MKNLFAQGMPVTSPNLTGTPWGGYPGLLALDFDGVLCDGLQEYFHTAWRVYCRIWKKGEVIPPEGLAEQFYRMRPVIESGWEMPLLVRALLWPYPEKQLFSDWCGIAESIMEKDALSASIIGPRLNEDRDEQIRQDENSWLAMNRLYPGVPERLRSLLNGPVPLRIVTTKEERYARRILERQQIYLPEEWIVGRSAKRSKHETLRRYLPESGQEAAIWFVEDRLLTLQAIRRYPELASIRLFLADWGYNTAEERERARAEGIQILSLQAFCADLSVW